MFVAVDICFVVSAAVETAAEAAFVAVTVVAGIGPLGLSEAVEVAEFVESVFEFVVLVVTVAFAFVEPLVDAVVVGMRTLGLG